MADDYNEFDDHIDHSSGNIKDGGVIGKKSSFYSTMKAVMAAKESLKKGPANNA
jgi:hypothetical protein